MANTAAPYNEIIIRSVFVYSHEIPDDQYKQANDDFGTQNGKCSDNLIVHLKNGAFDFMPMSPFLLLFGAMPKTQLMMDFQTT